MAGLRWELLRGNPCPETQKEVARRARMGKDTAGRRHREGKKGGVERRGVVSGEAREENELRVGGWTGVRRVPGCGF